MTIEPGRFRSSMSAAAARSASSVPVRFTSSTRRQLSRSRSTRPAPGTAACSRLPARRLRSASRSPLRYSPWLTPAAVDQDVDAAELTVDLLEEALVVALARRVEVHEPARRAVRAQLGGGGLAGLVQQVGHDDGGALGREALGAGPADAVAPSGDDRDLPLEPATALIGGASVLQGATTRSAISSSSADQSSGSVTGIVTNFEAPTSMNCSRRRRRASEPVGDDLGRVELGPAGPGGGDVGVGQRAPPVGDQHAVVVSGRSPGRARRRRP